MVKCVEAGGKMEKGEVEYGIQNTEWNVSVFCIPYPKITKPDRGSGSMMSVSVYSTYSQTRFSWKTCSTGWLKYCARSRASDREGT